MMKISKEVQMRIVLIKLDLEKGLRYKKQFGDWPEGFRETIKEFDDYLRSMIPVLVEKQDTETEKSEAADKLLEILDKINKAIN
jgi:hypothetical protein